MIDLAAPRECEEWRGKSADAPVPPRVRLRIYLRFGGRCQCGCNRSIRAGEQWDIDHSVAISNGGENRESNMRLLLREHHKEKTKQDVAEKSRTYRKRLRHLGIKTRKGQPMAGSRASKWKRKMDGTVVLREGR